MRKLKLLVLTLMSFTGSNLIAQTTSSPETIKAIEEAETRMFKNMNYSHAAEYYKSDVADDFFTINADGVWANRAESLADTARLKMVGSAELKILDRKIRVYDNVGVTNGRAQAYINNTMVVEFLYTTIFVKRNGKWMYTSWQGTISKNSPKLPPAP